MRIREGEEVDEKSGRKWASKGVRNEVQKGERTWLRLRTWLRKFGYEGQKKGRSLEEGNEEKEKGKVKIEE